MTLRFVMTEDALASQGEQWRGVILVPTDTVIQVMARGRKAKLYYLAREDNGEPLPEPLYSWQLHLSAGV